MEDPRENGRAQVLREALEAVLFCDADPLPKLFTENVSGWGPNMLVSSLGELTDLVAQREDALSDVVVHVDALDVAGIEGLVEYRVMARFTRPFVVADDVVIEPNGRSILLGAALVAEFTGHKISAFRNYFDDVTLLEQMLIAA